MKIKYAAISETGQRPNNEDAYRVTDNADEQHWMGIVCDGMGGHSKGEVASETVINVLVDYFGQHADMADSDEKVEDACGMASRELDAQSDEMGQVEMGTTMVMASIRGDKLMVAHVGDSRCYVMRPGEGRIIQTCDHTRQSEGREYITRCFFSYRSEVCVPDMKYIKVKAGDRILICSDGLYRCMSSRTFEKQLMDDKTPEEILHTFAERCEDYANDNYTAILAFVEE